MTSIYSSAFIQKLDYRGDLVWARQLRGSYSEGTCIAVDASGYVYVAGHFKDTVDFDPGPIVHDRNSNGEFDIFVLKLNPNGTLAWSRVMGGFGNDQAFGLAVDTLGNVYTTGRFSHTVDFDPAYYGEYSLTANDLDIFIQKLDKNGHFVWARRMGGVGIDSGFSIALDAQNNVYTTGSYRGMVDFNPGLGTHNLTGAGYDDAFIQKLDTNGQFLWARAISGMFDDRGLGIALDANNHVYTTGNFTNTVDFDPGLGTFILSAVGSPNTFVQKLDSNGNFIWARAFQGDSNGGHSVATDILGNIFITGYFSGTVDFDPHESTFNLTGEGGSDIFIQKLTPSGNFVWARAIGGTYYDQAGAVAVDFASNVYTIGTFYNNVDFDPGTGTEYIESAGLADIFVQKLQGPPDLSPPSAVSIIPNVIGPTNASNVSFSVIFSEGVLHFNSVADLVITRSGAFENTGSISGVGHAYIVNLSGITGTGYITLSANTASDVTDYAGNPLASSVVSVQVLIDNSDPVFSNLSVEPENTPHGTTATISFLVDESLQGPPEVTVNGGVATPVGYAIGKYTYSFYINEYEPLGAAVISISGVDLAGNVGILVNSTALTIVPPPAVPLTTWPVALALLAAGIRALIKR